MRPVHTRARGLRSSGAMVGAFERTFSMIISFIKTSNGPCVNDRPNAILYK